MDAVLPEIGLTLGVDERRLRYDEQSPPSLMEYLMLIATFRNFDVNMLTLSNAQERELEDWKRLFASVDTRFKWKGVVEPEGSDLALIEAVWEPGHT